jgi:outer membrane protein assembly factor BamB
VLTADIAALPRSAFAQLRGGVQQQEGIRGRRRDRLPRVAALESALNLAIKTLKTDAAKGLDLLQAIIESPEDSPYDLESNDRPVIAEFPTLRPSEDSNTAPDDIPASIKDTAEDQILANAETLLPQYELRFGPTARSLEQDAVQKEDAAALREIARRYALTDAGVDAMWRLAIAAFDDGDTASVRRWCNRLRRQGAHVDRLEPRLSLLSAWTNLARNDASAATADLTALKARSPQGLELDGRAVPWFASEEGMAPWLERLLPQPGAKEPVGGLQSWKVAFGDRRRNGLSPVAPPFLDTGWKYPLTDQFDDRYNPANVELVTRLAAELAPAPGTLTQPLLNVQLPLIVGDRVIFSGYGSLKSVLLSTGECDWSGVSIDDTLKQFWSETNPSVVHERSALLERFLAQRAYRDHASCAISTDGSQVYRLAQCGIVGGQMSYTGIPMAVRNDNLLLPRSFNSLQAYKLDGGVMRWEKGGPPRPLNAETPADDPLDLVGSFFLSAPIVWKGELLTVAEQSNQVRLYSLDPEDGHPLWLQALLNVVEGRIADSPERRYAGVLPAIDGSTFVATLGDGTIVAFDVAQRRWLWSFTYRNPSPIDPNVMMMRNFGQRNPMRNSVDSILQTDGWLDPRTLIAGSRVLATPMDGDDLVCLDLETGKRLWTAPRGDSLYLDGVSNQVAVVVGPTEIRAYRITDGSLAWTTSIPAPSGRGVRMANRYSFPTASAEIITIDLENGHLLARSALPSGRPAGNLVAAPGILISQTPSEVRAFRSNNALEAEIGKRLAENPAAPQALSLRGEWALHRGEIDKGEADLQVAADAGDSRAKQALAWSLVSGLERDYDRYESRIPEIEQFEPSLRAQAWQFVADGRQRNDDFAGAIVAILRAAEAIDEPADRLLAGEDALRIRQSRLLFGRAADLAERLSPDDRTALREHIRVRLTELVNDAVAFDRAAAVLPTDLVPEDAVLARLESSPTPLIQVEQRLLKLRDSKDLKIAAKASLQLVRLAVTNPQSPFPQTIIDDLYGRLADVSVEEGRPAAQVLRSLLNSPELTDYLSHQRWPAGRLSAHPAEAQGIPEYQAPISVGGPRPELLAGWTFAADASGTGITACDALGVFRWKEPAGNRDANGVEPRLSVNGRLMLLEFTDNFRILDASTGQTIRTIGLWGELSPELQGRPFRSIPMRAPGARAVGPLLNNYVAYVERPRSMASSIRGLTSRLIAMEPLTGRELWSRPIDDASGVSADEQTVVVAQSQGQMSVFRAADGRLLTTSQLPSGWSVDRDYQNGVLRLLQRPATESTSEFGMFDPLQNDFVWKRQAARDAKFDLVDGRDLAIYEPDGQFRLIEGETGREQISLKLDPTPNTQFVTVLRDPERLYICVSDRLEIGGSRSLVGPLSKARPAEGNLFAVDRRTSELLWKQEMHRQAVTREQPGRWPILVFSIVQTQFQQERPGTPSRTTSIRLINRSTGETVYQGELPTSRDGLRGWKADIAKGTITLRFGEAGLQVRSGADPEPAKPADGPPPPQVPLPDAPPPPPGSSPFE